VAEASSLGVDGRLLDGHEGFGLLRASFGELASMDNCFSLRSARASSAVLRASSLLISWEAVRVAVAPTTRVIGAVRLISILEADPVEAGAMTQSSRLP